MALRPDPEPTPVSAEVAAHQARDDLNAAMADVTAIVDELIAVDPSHRWLVTFVDASFTDPNPDVAAAIVPLLRQLYAAVRALDINLNRLSAVMNADDEHHRFYSAPGFTVVEEMWPADSADAEDDEP